MLSNSGPRFSHPHPSACGSCNILAAATALLPAFISLRLPAIVAEGVPTAALSSPDPAQCLEPDPKAFHLLIERLRTRNQLFSFLLLSPANWAPISWRSFPSHLPDRIAATLSAGNIHPAEHDVERDQGIKDFTPLIVLSGRCVQQHEDDSPTSRSRRTSSGNEGKLERSRNTERHAAHTRPIDSFLITSTCEISLPQ